MLYKVRYYMTGFHEYSSNRCRHYAYSDKIQLPALDDKPVGHKCERSSQDREAIEQLDKALNECLF